MAQADEESSSIRAHEFTAYDPMPSRIPFLIIAGPLRMEYFLLPNGDAHSPVLGGPALYAAAGARQWASDGIGLVSRVGRNFSEQSILDIQHKGLDTSGIRIFPAHPPALGFHYYETWEKHIDWDPAKYFAKKNLPCPEELLNYSPPSLSESLLQHYPDTAIRSEDIPAEYFEARAAYIAPCHYQSQITLSVSLRQNGVRTILLSPPEGLLLPSFRSQIREILHGIDILFVREKSLQAFIGDGERDPLKISEYIAHWGPKIVILQNDFQGIHIYDSESGKGYFIPFYPVEMKNPVSIGDSFCGGFLAVWQKTFDLVESTLVGCIAASLSMEGLGALYALERNPGLAQARLTSLRRSVRQ
jgi:sugar/nucleoside kinase (ribokinase family)